MILVNEADMFLSESLRILAERLSQSEIGLPLRQIRCHSPPEKGEVFSTEINLKFSIVKLPRAIMAERSVLVKRELISNLPQAKRRLRSEPIAYICDSITAG